MKEFLTAVSVETWVALVAILVLALIHPVLGVIGVAAFGAYRAGLLDKFLKD